MRLVAVDSGSVFELIEPDLTVRWYRQDLPASVAFELVFDVNGKFITLPLRRDVLNHATNLQYWVGARPTDTGWRLDVCRVGWLAEWENGVPTEVRPIHSVLLEDRGLCLRKQSVIPPGDLVWHRALLTAVAA